MKKQFKRILEEKNAGLARADKEKIKDIPEGCNRGEAMHAVGYCQTKIIPELVSGSSTYAVSCYHTGFTLIELLVVILIIGILAAVALPQYQMAVLKSRLRQAVPYLRAVRDAEEVYYLANGKYTTNMDDLDVAGVCPENWTCSIGTGEAKVGATYNDYDKVALMASFDHRTTNVPTVGHIYCAVSASAPQFAKKLCASMGPLLDDTGGFWRYAISQ